MLKLVDIRKDYKAGNSVVHALKGINLAFRRTEFVSILGHSGCGKTTMLNIIGGLDRYTSGDMFIDGVSTKKYKDVDWDTYRNIKIGFVFQSYNLIQHLTILDNVAMALTLSGVGLSERKRRAEEALKTVGLEGQMKKLPNQLSGGQMQRVSIARAIVNNPEIILADEPTGALDSTTSVQVMELLKEISRTKLVIMVTHNQELAEKYSTRIVSVKDGEIVGDTMPYEGEEEIASEEFNVTVKEKKKKLKKSSMSYSTAIKLSFKNLMTKKGRTLMTSIAGSIGIIGVCLVLAISNGFTNYVSDLQQTVLAGYPVQIAQETMDMTGALGALMGGTAGNNNKVQYPEDDFIYQYNPSDTWDKLIIENDFGQDYIDYVDKVKEKGWANSVTYSYGMQTAVIGKTAKGSKTTYTKVNPVKTANDIVGGIMGVSSANIGWSEMIGGEDFILTQYDLIAGTFPQDKTQVILVVDSYNQVNINVLAGLGFADTQKQVAFEDIVGVKLRMVSNDEIYVRDEDGLFEEKTSSDALGELYNAPESDTNFELEVVGVLRPKKDTQLALLSSGINYTSELTQYMLGVNSGDEHAQRDNQDNIDSARMFRGDIACRFVGNDRHNHIRFGSRENERDRHIEKSGREEGGYLQRFQRRNVYNRSACGYNRRYRNVHTQHPRKPDNIQPGRDKFSVSAVAVARAAYDSRELCAHHDSGTCSFVGGCKEGSRRGSQNGVMQASVRE